MEIKIPPLRAETKHRCAQPELREHKMQNMPLSHSVMMRAPRGKPSAPGLGPTLAFGSSESCSSGCPGWASLTCCTGRDTRSRWCVRITELRDGRLSPSQVGKGAAWALKQQGTACQARGPDAATAPGVRPAQALCNGTFAFQMLTRDSSARNLSRGSLSWGTAGRYTAEEAHRDKPLLPGRRSGGPRPVPRGRSVGRGPLSTECHG